MEDTTTRDRGRPKFAWKRELILAPGRLLLLGGPKFFVVQVEVLAVDGDQVRLAVSASQPPKSIQSYAEGMSFDPVAPFAGGKADGKQAQRRDD